MQDASAPFSPAIHLTRRRTPDCTQPSGALDEFLQQRTHRSCAVAVTAQRYDSQLRSRHDIVRGVVAGDQRRRSAYRAVVSRDEEWKMTTEPTITAHEATQVERANASSATPVVFVHGLWLLPSSWDRWVTLFE